MAIQPTEFTPAWHPERVACPRGGFAPCFDDLCHGSDRTLCGLWRYEDFCEHGYYPDSCDICSEPDWGEADGEEDDDGRAPD